jgi:hypothetical protein
VAPSISTTVSDSDSVQQAGRFRVELQAVGFEGLAEALDLEEVLADAALLERAPQPVLIAWYWANNASVTS